MSQNPDNLPVPTEGPVVPIRNPEEFAAACQATSWLARVCADHREELIYAREADHQDDDQFLWGQDFDATPEVWDAEDWRSCVEIDPDEYDDYLRAMR